MPETATAPATKATAPKARPIYKIGPLLLQVPLWSGGKDNINYEPANEVYWTGTAAAQTRTSGTTTTPLPATGKTAEPELAPFTPAWLEPEKAKARPKKPNGIVAKKKGMQRIPALIRPFVKLAIKGVLSLLDLLSAPWAKFPGRDHTSTALWSAGSIILVLTYVLWEVSTKMVGAMITNLGLQDPMATYVQYAIHSGVAIIGVGAVSLICGGIRLNNGKSFQQMWALILNPPPAFTKGPTFELGTITVSLKDLHTNIIAFGGVGTGKTASIIYPLLRQFCEKVNNDDPSINCEDPAQKFGALILDEKGDFIDFTLAELKRVGRSINDVIILDPDLEFFRYNPIDDSQSPQENANKLALVQSIISGGGGGGENKYWDDTSKNTIVNFLTLFKLYKGLERTGLDDIAKFVRDDAYAQFLVEECEKKIEAAKAANQMSFQDESIYMDAVSNVRNNWLALLSGGSSTGQILKTTIANMLGPLAQDPKLQRVFCRDRNFTFKDVINEGKIVMFRSAKIDKSTKKLIAVCLKLDFQTWMKRRNGATAVEFGLNTNRTCIKLIDEYQEFYTPGDEEFYGVSRSAKCSAIVATQSVSSLLTAAKRDKERTDTLIQNLCTKIFLRTTDHPTQDLGEQLAGQARKENLSTSVSKGGLVDSMISMNNSSSGPGSISVSEALEQNFRKDAFGKLMTVDGDKSATGPYYSEAILYHYHDTEALTDSRCYRTDFPHLYYSKEQKKAAAARVLAQSQAARSMSIIWYNKRCLLATRERAANHLRVAISRQFSIYSDKANVQVPPGTSLAQDVDALMAREKLKPKRKIPAAADATTGATPIIGPNIDGQQAETPETDDNLTDMVVNNTGDLMASGITTAGTGATLQSGSLLSSSLSDRPDNGDPRLAAQQQKEQIRLSAAEENEKRTKKLMGELERQRKYLDDLKEGEEIHPGPASKEAIVIAEEQLAALEARINGLLFQDYQEQENYEPHIAEDDATRAQDSRPFRPQAQDLQDITDATEPEEITMSAKVQAVLPEPEPTTDTAIPATIPDIPDPTMETPETPLIFDADDQISDGDSEENETAEIKQAFSAVTVNTDDEAIDPTMPTAPAEEGDAIVPFTQSEQEKEELRLAELQKAAEKKRKADEAAAAEAAANTGSSENKGEGASTDDKKDENESTPDDTQGENTEGMKEKLDDFFAPES